MSGPLAVGSYLLIWLFDVGVAAASFVLTRTAATEAPTNSFVDAAYIFARITAAGVGLLTWIIFGI